MIDPQAKTLIDLIAQRGLPPMQSLAPVEALTAGIKRYFAKNPPLARSRPL